MEDKSIKSRLRARRGIMGSLGQMLQNDELYEAVTKDGKVIRCPADLDAPLPEVHYPVIVKPSGKAARRRRRELERKSKHKKK